MSPREFQIVVEGYRERIEDEQRLAAWHACIIANVWLPRGKKMEPKKLLARNRELPVFLDAASFREYMRGRVAAAKEA